MELHLFSINFNKPMIHQSSLIFRWIYTFAVQNNECIHKKKVSQIKYSSKIETGSNYQDPCYLFLSK